LKDQQLDLRTPIFEAEIEDRGSWHRLVVRLTSQRPLVAIRVTLLGDNNLQFSDSQHDVQHGTPAPRKTATWNSNHPEQGGLRPGDTAVWRIDLGDEQRQDTRPEQLSLRIVRRQYGRREVDRPHRPCGPRGSTRKRDPLVLMA